MQRFKIIQIILLWTCAVIVTILVIRRELSSNQLDNSLPTQILSDSLWQMVSESTTAAKLRSGGVTIVKFYDYQCSFCKEFQPVLDAIRIRYPEKITVIYRHYPLTYHSGAYTAAIAAECAKEQGVFETFHNILYVYQAQLSGDVEWNLLAQEADVPNRDVFHTCMTKRRPALKIDADTTMASVLNIEGVPTVILNGSMYYGVMSLAELDTIIQGLLEDTH